MAVEDHLKLAILIDGVQQVKVTSISMNFISGAQDVETLEGFAGKTPGSRKAEVTVNWAIGIGGAEFNFQNAVAEGSYHDVQVPQGDVSYVGRGYWREASISQSVNSPTEGSATFVGEFNPLE